MEFGEIFCIETGDKEISQYCLELEQEMEDNSWQIVYFTSVTALATGPYGDAGMYSTKDWNFCTVICLYLSSSTSTDQWELSIRYKIQKGHGF